MLELLRKHQHGIMIVVAFIVIVAFAWFFNPYDTRTGGSLSEPIAFKIGSEGITVKEVERQTRVLQTANGLGFNFTMQLLQPTFDVVDFTQNRYLLGREARKLGIDPSEEEVQKAIAEHPPFQRNGTFSEDAYLDAIRNTLEPNGLMAGDLRNLVADKIRLEKLTALLSSGVSVPPSVVNVEYQRANEKVTASVIDFKLEDFETDIEVTDEELQTYYEEQKALVPSAERQLEGRLEEAEQAALELIMSPEKRKIEFVFFEEPAAPVAPPSTPTTTPQVPEPPLLLRPEAPGPPPGNPGGALTAPPIELEVPPVDAADDESEPPGQSPQEEKDGGLEIEPLEAPPVTTDGELELTPAEELGSELNAGGLNDDLPSLDLDLEGGNDPSTSLELDLEDLGVSSDPGGASGSGGGNVSPATAAAMEDHAAKVDAYLAKVDSFYTAAIESEAADPLNAEAAKIGMEVQTTDFFAEDDPPEDPKVPAKLVTVTFKGSLENDRGILVPVEGVSPKGYYVARLLDVQESREQSLAEVKEDLREALVREKAIEAMEEAAKSAREKLVAGLEEEKAFAELVAELGLTVRDIPEFSVRNRPTGEDDAAEIVAAASTTTTGSVSEMQQPEDKAILVHVSQRVAAEELADAETPTASTPPGATPPQTKEALTESLERQASSGMVRLWLADRRESADIVRDRTRVPPRIYFPQNLFGGGGGGGLNF